MDTARLRAMLAAGTPGPWCTDEVDADQICVFGTVFAAASRSEDATWLFDPRDATADDARLLVAAVNALPRLLDIADAAQALLDAGNIRPFVEYRRDELRAALRRLEEA